MINVRMHGRGGQGVVATAEIIALAAFENGWFCQGFPAFGVERSGAPISAFARLSNEPIVTREQIYNPQIVLVADATLLNSIDISFGANKDTIFLVNSNQAKKELIKTMKSSKKQSFIPQEKNIKTIDATSIALKIFQKNLNNTALLGALSSFAPFTDLNSVAKAISEKFIDKGPDIIKKNILASREAAKQLQ